MIFKPELAEKIVAGEKTATRRRLSDNPRSPWYRDRCRYVVGREFTVNPGRGVRRVCSAVVTAVYKQPLGEMTNGHARDEGFEDSYAFWLAWSEINGGFDPVEDVWVIEFVLVPESVVETAQTPERAA